MIYEDDDRGHASSSNIQLYQADRDEGNLLAVLQASMLAGPSLIEDRLDLYHTDLAGWMGRVRREVHVARPRSATLLFSCSDARLI